jgi:hypothetical protein
LGCGNRKKFVTMNIIASAEIKGVTFCPKTRRHEKESINHELI